MSAVPHGKRVLSGMRPTGALHLGNYHGALRNWVELQYQYECFFFVADWHALTTGYEDTSRAAGDVHEVLIDWLAAGLNPGVATLFVQSHVPEHAELHLLLSMITPLGWLERVPTYKDQQEQLKEKDLATYGFLGYPLLQSADILLYRAGVRAGGRGPGGARGDHARDRAPLQSPLRARAGFRGRRPSARSRSWADATSRSTASCAARFQETGDAAALERARALVESNTRITVADRERLLGYLEGSCGQHPARAAGAADRQPQGARARRPQDVQVLRQHHRRCARIRMRWRRSCAPCRPIRRACAAPIRATRRSARCGICTSCIRMSRRGSGCSEGCRSAGIGCLDCKQPLIERIVEEVSGMRKRAQEFEDNPDWCANILIEGAEKAREAARATLDEVRRAMHLRPQ